MVASSTKGVDMDITRVTGIAGAGIAITTGGKPSSANLRGKRQPRLPLPIGSSIFVR
jgi:hypothetical protein